MKRKLYPFHYKREDKHIGSENAKSMTINHQPNPPQNTHSMTDKAVLLAVYLSVVIPSSRFGLVSKQLGYGALKRGHTQL